MLFLFKQKTAYEMRISDWSSDVCSSDLATIDQPGLPILPLGEVEAIDLTWAGDKYVIARVASWEKFGPRVEYRFERNLAIDTHGKILSQLLGTEAASALLINQPVLGVVASDPVRVMVDRKRVVWGKGGSLRVDLGGGRIIK